MEGGHFMRETRPRALESRHSTSKFVKWMAAPWPSNQRGRRHVLLCSFPSLLAAPRPGTGETPPPYVAAPTFTTPTYGKFLTSALEVRDLGDGSLRERILEEGVFDGSDLERLSSKGIVLEWPGLEATALGRGTLEDGVSDGGVLKERTLEESFLSRIQTGELILEIVAPSELDGQKTLTLSVVMTTPLGPFGLARIYRLLVSIDY